LFITISLNNISHHFFTIVFCQELLHKLFLECCKFRLLQTDLSCQALADIVLLDALVASFILALDKPAQGLEASEEVEPFNEQVELPGYDVYGHALVRDQYVVWNVFIDQMIQHDTRGMRECLLGVFQGCLLAIVPIGLRGEDQSADGPPAEDLPEADAALVHVDLI
jgi:hypothetical protein